MRTDLLRWGGIFSLLLAILFAVVLALGFAMGVDIYEDNDVDKMLTDIDDNQVAFAAWSILGMTTSLFFFPAALGFYYAARERTVRTLPSRRDSSGSLRRSASSVTAWESCFRG